MDITETRSLNQIQKSFTSTHQSIPTIFDAYVEPSRLSVSKCTSLTRDWDNIIRKEDSRVLVAGQFSPDYTKAVEHNKSLKTFCTNSTYEGKWNKLNMNGFGVYTLPHGCEYTGMLTDGMFHGEGMLRWPQKQIMYGVWNFGNLESFKFVFADGLEYAEPWSYCRMPDRRFFNDVLQGLQPADRELLTNRIPTRDIDKDCYDIEVGFFNSVTKCAYVPKANKEQKIIWDVEDDEELEKMFHHDMKILRVPSRKEERWITKHCRKAWDEVVGYQPTLYEQWCIGTEEELEHLDGKLRKLFLSVTHVGEDNPENLKFDI